VARVPEGEIARLKAEVSLARLVEGCGVVLARQGADLLGGCPFHDDKTPSLLVSPAKNVWHCLGACQAGGSVIDWVMRAQGVSFRHAVELLREDSASLSVLAAGSPLSSVPGPGRRSSAVKLAPLAPVEAADSELLGRVIGFYASTLADASQNGDAVSFLHRRKIAHPEAVQAFRLGFANRTLGYRLPHSQTVAGRELRTRLQRLGVLRGSGHEHFTGCLVIPVLDVEGRVGEVYGRKVTDRGLRATQPRHLFLPGPHRGIFNPPAFAGEELIVTESLVDALSLWCAGFRHVTAAFGADGWTPEMQAAVVEHGVRRVLIAYDRDPAGDAGAKNLAAQLMATGVECFRVELPAGADVNEVSVEATNPTDVLGRFLRRAAWMGTGPTPKTATSAVAPAMTSARASLDATGETLAPALLQALPASEPASPVELPGPGSSLAAGVDLNPDPVEAVEPAGLVEPGLVSPVPQATASPAPVVSGRELVLRLGERRWRVRGLDKVTSFDLLRVNVLVALDAAAGADASATHRFHVDTLDLYSARARQVFVATAAAELGLEPEVVKRDLGRVLLVCEARAEEVIAAAQTPVTPEVVISAEARAAALAFLAAPDLVERIAADFATVGIVGEAGNALVGYLAAVSRKLPAPLAVIVQSTSAAGKSVLMEAVLGFVPPEDRVSFSAMTGQSLFYLGESDLSHKVLSIAEEEGASRAAYALKLLQSEGELSIASTGKDTASGRLVTHTYRVEGPTAIVLTTTAIDVDEELLNRCLVLTVDEDRAQTRAIHDAQRKAQTLAGLAARAERDAVIGLHRDAQRLLQPLPVVNPFADALTFTDGRTRTRRDHGKYLGLISAVTLLHQHQRPKRSTTVGGRQVTYVETTLADIAIANRLAHAVLGQSLDELPPQTRRLLTAIGEHVTAEAKKSGVDVELVRFTRRQLREALTGHGTGWGDTQLKVHLARLVDLELVAAHRTDRGSFTYELTWRGEGRGGQPFLIGLTDPVALTETIPDSDSGQTGYDTNRSGPEPAWSGSGRPSVGGWSAPGRAGPETASAQVNGHGAAAVNGDGPERTDPVPDQEAVVHTDVVLAAVAGGR